MVDYGIYQGLPELRERNYTHPAGVDWSEIDAILLTHAHLDHSGLIPRAVKLGYRGPVYAHSATVDISEIMFKDSAEIQERDAEWLSRKRKRAGRKRVEPLYTKRDASRAMRQFRPVEYGKPFEVVPGVTAEFHDAGHILGSASIAVDCVEGDLKRRIVFSGDIGHHQAPILREPHPFERADAVLIETTYGNRTHESPATRREAIRKIVRKAISQDGKVVIPAFAVGRTQEVLYILGDLINDGEIPSIPIYLDSPMAIRATAVHEKHQNCFDRETMERIRAGDNPFYPPTLHLTRTVPQSRAINRVRGPAVIIAGSGMCEGGRIAHHLKHTLYNPLNQLVFVGWQAAGTLGRLILQGGKKVRLFGEEIAVKAEVKAIGAFSAHADRDGLVNWLGFLREPPEVAFMVHGEKRATEDFAETVREKLGYVAYVPRLGQRVDLARLDELIVGPREFVPRPTPKAEDIYEIAARVATLGEEFGSMVEGYVAELGHRVQGAMMRGEEPHWRTEDVSEVLRHLAEVVDGDMDRLQALMGSVKSAESDGDASQ